MKVFGIAGWSGSGKTTLITKLIPEIINRGRKVSTIKHTHHSFDIDKPGKDSHSHRLAGATEVLVGSSQKWALIHEDKENKRASSDQNVGTPLKKTNFRFSVGCLLLR